MDSVIAAHGLTKLFGGRAVVNRLNLAVPRGAIYALLGDNGAGKSTTIRMLMGLLPPDAGRAEILGQDCWSAAIPLRFRVGYVPERPRFYDWMTVEEIGRFSAGFHRAGFQARYRELIERFRLERKGKLGKLSKGGYAKVGLALALAPDPEVLILDEPTSGLDLFIRREFLASMVDLAGEGRTILISSHGIAEVERVASHVAILAEGRLLLAAPLEELRRRIIRVRLRYLGDPPDFTGLGTLLDSESSGREWRGALQDPDRVALDELAHRPDVVDLEESTLSLEDIYTAVLARYHRPGAGGVPPNGRHSSDARPAGRHLDAERRLDWEKGGRP
jgi:ABC-2 type transport system ATP-binding protein